MHKKGKREKQGKENNEVTELKFLPNIFYDSIYEYTLQLSLHSEKLPCIA